MLFTAAIMRTTAEVAGDRMKKKSEQVARLLQGLAYACSNSIKVSGRKKKEHEVAELFDDRIFRSIVGKIFGTDISEITSGLFIVYNLFIIYDTSEIN